MSNEKAQASTEESFSASVFKDIPSAKLELSSPKTDESGMFEKLQM